MSTCKRLKAEHRVLSTIAHTKEAMGGHQYGFCVGFTENAKGS
jgi:hypothetical protein